MLNTSVLEGGNLKNCERFNLFSRIFFLNNWINFLALQNQKLFDLQKETRIITKFFEFRKMNKIFI